MKRHLVRRFLAFLERLYLRFLGGHPHTTYPIGPDGRLWFSRPMFPDTDGAFYAGHYKQNWVRRPPFSSIDRLDAEILWCQQFHETAEATASTDCVVPVMVTDHKDVFGAEDKPIDVTVDGQDLRLPFLNERFHYLKLERDRSMAIRRSNAEILLGSPIPLAQQHSTRFRLVLPLFVDGLASQFFNYVDLRELMPRTSAFFSTGLTFDNCRSTSEWSLSSLATIFTGLRTQQHGVFHPLSERLDPTDPVISELFQRNGYLTSQICSNWRKSPALGYCRGYDRTLYGRYLDAERVTVEFLDLLRAFPERSIFSWLTFFDLHFPHEGLIPSIDVQLSDTFSHLRDSLHDPNAKSVLFLEDQATARNYIAKIRRVDFYLGLIFDHIESNYDDRDVFVVLFADHGQSYFDSDPNVLSEMRIRVPLMVKGGSVPAAASSALVETIDVFDLLASCCSGDHGEFARVRRRIEAKEYAFAETVYPGRKYGCVFNTKDGSWRYESAGGVDEHGRFDISTITSDARPTEATGDGERFRKELESYLAQSRLMASPDPINRAKPR